MDALVWMPSLNHCLDDSLGLFRESRAREIEGRLQHLGQEPPPSIEVQVEVVFAQANVFQELGHDPVIHVAILPDIQTGRAKTEGFGAGDPIVEPGLERGAPTRGLIGDGVGEEAQVPQQALAGAKTGYARVQGCFQSPMNSLQVAPVDLFFGVLVQDLFQAGEFVQVVLQAFH